MPKSLRENTYNQDLQVKSRKENAVINAIKFDTEHESHIEYKKTKLSMEELRSQEKALIDKILPWDRFSAWVHGICVVTFDLELGQAIESVYPAHVTLAEAEKTNICYLAFPDSNSGVMGDSQFHFRIRLSPQANKNRQGHLSKSRIHTEYNRRCPSTIAYDPNYLFGTYQQIFITFVMKLILHKSTPRI